MEGKLSTVGYNAGNKVLSLADKKNRHQQQDAHSNGPKKEDENHPQEQKEQQTEVITQQYDRGEIEQKLLRINEYEDYKNKRINFKIVDEGSSFVIVVTRNEKPIQELMPHQILEIEKLVQKKKDKGEPIKGSLLNIAC